MPTSLRSFYPEIAEDRSIKKHRPIINLSGVGFRSGSISIYHILIGNRRMDELPILNREHDLQIVNVLQC